MELLCELRRDIVGALRETIQSEATVEQARVLLKVV